MPISGEVMLIIGIVGLLAVIIWILVDLIRKDKREAKLVEKAVANTSKQPVKKSYNAPVSFNTPFNTPASLHMAGGLNRTTVRNKADGVERTAGPGKTEATGQTKALGTTFINFY
ncbi:MAG TPA: hypothetical protein GXX36_03105 [Clostridiaceae bacterium]|nr:hypothetical protein [Clostridiaceae bacterium]